MVLTRSASRLKQEPADEDGPQTAEQVASALGVPDAAETVYLLLEHLAANGRARSSGADNPGQVTFSKD